KMDRRTQRLPRPVLLEHAVLFFQIAKGGGDVGHGEGKAPLTARAHVVANVEAVELHAEPTAIGVVGDLGGGVLDSVLAVIVDGFGAGVEASMIGIAEAGAHAELVGGGGDGRVCVHHVLTGRHEVLGVTVVYGETAVDDAAQARIVIGLPADPQTVDGTNADRTD